MVHGDHADGGAHAGFQNGFSGGIRKEIHVVEAGDAAAQHLGAGQQRAVAHELGRDVASLGGPDVMLEPLHERQVVGQAAHQVHCGMGVEIDQAGDEGMLVQRDGALGSEARMGFGGRQNGDDMCRRDYQAVMVEYLPRRFYGDHPACVNNRVGLLHRFARNRARKKPRVLRGFRLPAQLTYC